MKKRLLLLFWVLGILFPMALLGRVWPAFGRVFEALFAPDWVHVLMHGFLYLVLAFLLAGWLRPASPKLYALLLGLVLLVGVFHEGLQLVTRNLWPGWGPELFDLGVDLAGGTLGLVLFRLRFPHRSADVLLPGR